MRLLILTMVTLYLTGCVGVMTLTTTGKTTKRYSEHDYNCPSGNLGHFSRCGINREPSISEFISLWGEPKTQETKDGREMLIYNENLAWRGLVVFALIPIPLLIPAGHNEISLEFDHDKLVQSTSEFANTGPGLICGIVLNGFGCFAGK